MSVSHHATDGVSGPSRPRILSATLETRQDAGVSRPLVRETLRFGSGCSLVQGGLIKTETALRPKDTETGGSQNHGQIVIAGRPSGEYDETMSSVRAKEALAEQWAHLLDDLVHLPGTRIRFGLDPLLGLTPIVGDMVATVCGVVVIMTARQLRLPFTTQFIMVWHLFINGLVGSIPLFGDAFSFMYKCHVKNTAELLRQVKHGQEGSCLLEPRALGLLDIGVVLLLVGPVLAAIGLASWWFWEQDISLVTLLFPPPYSSE